MPLYHSYNTIVYTYCITKDIYNTWHKSATNVLQNQFVCDILYKKEGNVMINCDNYLCLYWKKGRRSGKCIFDSIDLDISGVCTTCIYFIDESENLDKLRAEKLAEEKN